MRTIIIASLIVALLVPQPAQAFSLRPVAHGLKVAAKKVGQVGLYVAAGVAVIVFCSQGACN